MKFTFTIEAVISMHIDVEAETLEAAFEEAKNSPTQSLCHQCAHGAEGEWNTSGELDADPASSKLVDCLIDGGDATDIATLAAKWEGGT